MWAPLEAIVDQMIGWIPDSWRERFRGGPRLDDWQDDLLGEAELRRVEEQPRWMRDLIRSVDDEVQAIRRERSRDG